MVELSEDQAILIEVAQMSLGELPRTYNELNHIVWDAFKLGCHYEQVKQNEQVKQEGYLPE